MKLFDTIHKRKSATITAIIMSLLLVAIFIFGLKYLDPPIESGIMVNFGTSNVGSGNVQPREPVKTQPTPVVEEEVIEEEVVDEIFEEEIVEESTPDDAPTEDVLTSESEESIRIKKEEKERLDKEIAEAAEKREKELAEKVEREAKEKAEREAKAEAARIQKEQDDKKRELDAMMGGLNNSDGSTTGEGDDNIAGDKGKVNGDPNADGYYGNGGSGGSGDYQLGSRKPLNRPKPDYECEEEGLVIVTIEVNRSGKVIKATAGAKGSTNTAACLLTRAKEAALKTTWQSDSNAGAKQIGIIKYRFSLSN